MTSSERANPMHKAGTAGPGLSSAMALLLATACGLSVANIYFAQPLLDAMARDFGIAPAAIGMVVTFTQIGYAFGLILIVPLGDLWDRRRLITGQIALTAIGLVVVGTASHAAVLLAGLALVGVLAVVVQILVAFAATLAAGLDGISRRIEPPSRFAGDAYAAADLPRVPATLPEAIDEFAASALFREAFGADVVEHLVHFARTEQRKFDETVTTWERRRYLERA